MPQFLKQLRSPPQWKKVEFLNGSAPLFFYSIDANDGRVGGQFRLIFALVEGERNDNEKCVLGKWRWRDKPRPRASSGYNRNVITIFKTLTKCEMYRDVIVNINKADKLNWLMIWYEWHKGTHSHRPCTNNKERFTPKCSVSNYFSFFSVHVIFISWCTQVILCVCNNDILNGIRSFYLFWISLCVICSCRHCIVFVYVIPISKGKGCFDKVNLGEWGKSSTQSRSPPPPASAHSFIVQSVRVRRHKIVVTFPMPVSTTHLPINLLRWLNR